MDVDFATAVGKLHGVGNGGVGNGISGGISCGSLSLSLLSPGIGGLLNPVAFKGPPFFGAFE